MRTESKIKELSVSSNGRIKLLLEVELSHISELDLTGLLSSKDIEKLLGNSKQEKTPTPMAAPTPIIHEPIVNDLKKIKGIGPKLEKILNAQGIKSFQQLTEKSFDDLRQILDQAELHIIDPTNWATQAKEFMQETA